MGLPLPHPLGLGVRASSIDILTSSLMGINNNAVAFIIFAITGILSAVAGVFYGIKYAVYPVMGDITIKAMIASIVGGLGSLPAAIVGSMILGVLETFVSGYISSTYRDLFSFAFLIVILLFFPNGLMGKKRSKRNSKGYGVPTVMGYVQAILTYPGGHQPHRRPGLAILTGYTGLFSIGHAGFMAVGGYMAAILAQGGPLPLASPSSAEAWSAGFSSFIIGYPAFRSRLRGDYFAIATLGFAEAIRLILNNVRTIGSIKLGGAFGYMDIPTLSERQLVLAAPGWLVRARRRDALRPCSPSP